CSDNSVQSESTPPSQPTNFTAAQVDSTTVDLNWTASSDNVVVAGYNIYSGSVLIDSTPVNSYRDTNFLPGATYAYTVEAYDCSQNLGPRSAPPDSVTIPGTPPSTDSTILRSAAAFVVLAGTTITNTGVGTDITGDVGLSPGSALVGLPPAQVTGTIHINDAAANQAKSSLTSAYLFLAGLPPGTTVAGNIGGTTRAPGTYTSSSTLAISSGDLTLDAGGNANAVFIFQVASALTVTSGRQVILAGSAQAKNVYWQIGSAATLGTTSAFQGNILALDAVTMATGASLNGRVFARNGAVTLDNNTITKP
ncbi:MAG TPA: ice-binding family protein, partial [candidate division Zixibacteria bacterium]|nr:ice-binding family protein [candidate division Zixibacteria bacterium]